MSVSGCVVVLSMETLTLLWCEVFLVLVRTGCSDPTLLLRPFALPRAIVCALAVFSVPVLLAARLVGALLLFLGLLTLACGSLALMYTNLLDRVLVDGLRRTLLDSNVARIEFSKLLVHLIVI